VTLAIGIDIGGTKVAAGVVDEDGAVLARARRRTPSRDPAHLVDVVGEIARQLLADHDVACLGVGAAGWVDADRRTVLFAPNLAWRDTPLRDEIVTIGTGIGGGIILNGQLYRGAFGIAGEPGHMRVVPGGRLCGCGNHGCWEQYCSGTALVRAAQEIATQRPQDGLRLRQIAGEIDAIDGPAVMSAAQEGDPAAVDCFQEIGRWLGQGLADLAAILDPGRFVVGGGVADAGELLLSPARETFASVLSGRGHRPEAEIVGAKLGSEAGLIGAADLARHE
jgi:glucokinase